MAIDPARVHDRYMGTGSDGSDTDGLGNAYLAFGGELLRYARRSLHDPQLAEEVVQETFARAWRSRATFDREVGPVHRVAVRH